MRSDTWLIETAGRSARGRVRALIQRVAADPAPWPGVRQLADFAAVTPRTLSRLLVRETGLSPARFVERARVRLACALLDEGAWPVSAIARRAGFRNDERMRCAFVRVLGMNPRAYLTAAAARCAGTAAALSIPGASACAPPRPTPTPR